MPTNDEIERFKRRAYTRIDEEGNEVMGVKGSSPQLTISRLRRCQNCLHFNTGEKALSYFNHCIERDKKTLRARGCSPEGIREHVEKLERGIRDMFGAVGFCTIRDKRDDKGVDGDFTPFQYLCDRWEGHLIISAQDAASDPLAEEVFANLKKVEE